MSAEWPRQRQGMKPQRPEARFWTLAGQPPLPPRALFASSWHPSYKEALPPTSPHCRAHVSGPGLCGKEQAQALLAQGMQPTEHMRPQDREGLQPRCLGEHPGCQEEHSQAGRQGADSHPRQGVGEWLWRASWRRVDRSQCREGKVRTGKALLG